MVDQFEQKTNEQVATLWKGLALQLPFMFSMVKVILSHPRQVYQIYKMAQQAKKKQKHNWQREKTELPYEIPQYESSMQRCTSKEKYLRPSFYIESDSPEIVALANKLGAFRLPDQEYADACFKFMRRSIIFNFSSPMKGARQTLLEGEAMCFDKANLFIALCRAGGIPARIRTSNTAFTEQIYEPFTTRILPIMKDLYDSVGYFAMHTMAEAFVDGKWQIADVSIDDAYQAVLGIPLSRFGDDASGQWNWEIPGKALIHESVPKSLARQMNFTGKFVSPIFLLIQDIWGAYIDEGKKIIAEAGGEEAYDNKIRQTYKAKLPEVSKKLFKLLNEEPREDLDSEGQAGKILIYDK